MSHPSSQKNGGNGIVPPPPRQIRFVSTDGLPQAKRRRISKACQTCRMRKIRCSGEYPVCKTCTDYNHTCFGYDKHVRSQSDSSSRRPTLPSDAAANDPDNAESTRAVESSPDLPSRTLPPSNKGNRKSPKISKSAEPRNSTLSRDSSFRPARELERTGIDSPGSSRSSLNTNNRTYVPYFRYFGPTAIVPGFKEMIVEIRGSRRSSSSSSGSTSAPRSPKSADAGANSPSTSIDSTRDANTIPFYDSNDILPVSNLVTHLCELFFDCLGCNFPFLQRTRFLQDLSDKKVNTMLVNAVCSLSARFSPHPLLYPPKALPIDGREPREDMRMSDRGQPFARRARGALVDSLSCPTLSVAQACLLLAYEEFGSNRDSGLWMYLGISIRMAQDLGMQKRRGPDYGAGGTTSGNDQGEDANKPHQKPEGPVRDIEEARKREREDTFWCIFFLDRVISSGTGRPVTLRDEEIELPFPPPSQSTASNGRPAPFPPLIRIIYLYGRATDIINGIQDGNDVTEDTVKRLASLESDLTGIYSSLSSKLYFDATNLQEYVMAKEGTSFILLHLWFHALIVLLHQPTLLRSFGGTIQQLYPNSRTLAMSSAKTIADIYSFSELLDNKSFIGNPFTSQPVYIAACAFLMESAYYTSPASKSGASSQPLLANQSSSFMMPDVGLSDHSEQKSIGAAQHNLLASIAKDNYQRCYKALKALEMYWEGIKYILTVLDQKSKGIVDPLLYTAEQAGDASKMLPSVQPLASAGQRRSEIDTNLLSAANSTSSDGRSHPRLDPSQAIGWALTNATDPQNPNLSVLYQNPSAQTNSSQHSHNYPSLPTQSSAGQVPSSYSQSVQQPRHIGSSSLSNVPTSAADLLMNLNVPYTNGSPSGQLSSSYNRNLPTSGIGTGTTPLHYHLPSNTDNHEAGNPHMASRMDYQPGIGSNASGVLIESQNIDMNMLQHPDNFPFAFNGDTLPWLEYLPPDVASLLGEQPHYQS